MAQGASKLSVMKSMTSVYRYCAFCANCHPTMPQSKDQSGTRGLKTSVLSTEEVHFNNREAELLFMKKVKLETCSGICLPKSMLRMSRIGARYLYYLENLILQVRWGFLEDCKYVWSIR